jgi:hypothetical protein
VQEPTHAREQLRYVEEVEDRHEQLADVRGPARRDQERLPAVVPTAFAEIADADALDA